MGPALIPLITQGALGAFQLAKGLSMNPKRPEYKIPNSVQQATNIAEQRLSQTVRPGDAEYRADIDQNVSNTVEQTKRVAGNSGQVMSAIFKSNVLSNREKRNNTVLNKSFQDQNMNQYITALNNRAGYEDIMFNINELMPYQEAAATKSALIGGGIQNLSNAGSDFASFKMYQDIFGQSSPATP